MLSKNRKTLALLLALLLAFSVAIPSTVFAVDGNYTVDQPIASLTEAREINATATFKSSISEASLTITYGGKALSEWKAWNAKEGEFTGSPFITAKVNASGNTANIKLKFDLAFGTNDLSSRDMRVRYPELLGNHELKITDKVSGESVSVPIKLNVFDEFTPYSEYPAKMKYIEENKKSDRYVEITTLGKTADGEHEQYFIVIAKNKATVDNYLNKQVPAMYANPGALKAKLNKGDKDYKIAVWFNNVHGDEAPGPDANLALATNFATKDSFKFDLKKSDGSDDYPKSTELKTADVLDNMILLFNITQNPYAKDNNRRSNVNGFDLNRDYTYQTQTESANFAAAINKWAPVSIMDFHGFYKQFIIEPCTGPHNDNYEYDLIITNLLSQAFTFGKAGVANSVYKSFDIPYADYKDGFDDANSCYTSSYGILNGALAQTIEIPDLNGESFKALVNGSYGALNYILNTKNSIANNQLEVFRRGVENIDSRGVDKYYTNAAGFVVGRARKGNENFFPEAYIIPVGEGQKSTSEAVKTLELLMRSGVKVTKLKTDVKIGNVKYAAGSFVVSMYQARRNLANIVLSKSADISDWGAMYAETVNDFPDMRGFTCTEIRAKNAFKNLTIAVSSPIVKKTILPKATQLAIENNSVDAVKAVNKVLSNGGKVMQLKNGSFIVSKSELSKVINGLVLDVKKAPEKIAGKILKKVKVYAVKSSDASQSAAKVSQLGFALQQMGFELTTDIKEADVIADGEGDSSIDKDIAEAVKAGKTYIAVGAYALSNVQKSGLAEGFTFNVPDYSYEGLMKADYTMGISATAGYGKTDLTYIANGATIKEIPAGAKVLASISKSKNFYVSGWWPNHNEIKGSTIGAQKDNMYFFASDLTNKAHSTFQFRILSNIILNK